MSKITIDIKAALTIILYVADILRKGQNFTRRLVPMLFRIIMLLIMLIGGKVIVSFIRRLKDEYRYNYQDVDRYIDHH